MENYIEDNRIHEGHRARMRAKLLTHGQDIFDTYELLEMLLYHVIPYKDTNPVAKRLLYAFGGLDGVFRANREELVQVSGVGERTADFLISVGRLSAVIGAEILPREKEDFADYETVGRFFVRYFSGVNEKCVDGCAKRKSKALSNSGKQRTVPALFLQRFETVYVDGTAIQR